MKPQRGNVEQDIPYATYSHVLYQARFSIVIDLQNLRAWQRLEI